MPSSAGTRIKRRAGAAARLARRFARLVVGRMLALGPRQFLANDHMLVAVLAILVGVMTGGGIIVFREGIDLMQEGLYGGEADRLASVAASLPWWLVLAPLVGGGLLVGLWHRLTMPDGRPENVSHVMEAALLRGGRMGVRRGLAAVLGAMLSLGSGASVGREGPAVHLGATVGGLLACLLGFGRGVSRTLLGCGAAGAVAASFNAPIAGALFAHEVIVGHYSASTFAPIVLASVSATIVSRLWFGADPAFILPPDLTLVSFMEFPAFALLGLVCGVVAAAFMVSVTGLEAVVRRSGLPSWLRPALAGLATGLIALAFPEVLGVGYEITDRALSGALVPDLAVMIVAAKVVATVLCLGLGFGGGVFSPSLVIGAVLGCAFGLVATAAVPEGLSSGPGAYAVVGMGAVAAAVLGAPISTSLIIFELTANYTLTMAVMTAVVVATLLSTGLTGHRSLFHWQMARRGLDVHGDRQRQVLAGLRVADLMTRRPPPMLSPEAGLDAVAAALREHGGDKVFVVDNDGRLLGSIVMPDVVALLMEPSGGAAGSRLARDVMLGNPPVLARGQTLGEALRAVEDLNERIVPVVHDRDTMRLVGALEDRAVLRAYARALAALRAEDRGER